MRGSKKYGDGRAVKMTFDAARLDARCRRTQGWLSEFLFMNQELCKSLVLN